RRKLGIRTPKRLPAPSSNEAVATPHPSTSVGRYLPMTASTSALPLPGFVGERLDAAARRFLHEHSAADFTVPAGEPALVEPDSVSWRIFANPVALFIGGVAAVILELAE